MSTSEGVAGGPGGGAPAGEDRAEHSACPDGVESNSSPEGGGDVAREPFHPVAEIWPPLGEPELQALADAIKAHGLRHPIVRHRDGRIVDGRNRWLACQKAGVECPSTTYEGQDGAELAAYVMSANDKRRHLTVGQRAAIAAELATLPHGSNQHGAKVEAPTGASTSALTDAEAARLMGVGERSVERAKAVKRADPPLHEKVKRGEVESGKARAELARKRGTGGAKKAKIRAATAAPPPPAETTAAPATDGPPSRRAAPCVSGADLWQEIISIKNECDKGAIERLKELKSLDRHSGRRRELLEEHIDAQVRFVAGLRSLHERFLREAAAEEAGA